MKDVVTAVAIWLLSIYGLSKFVENGGSWRWSVIVVGGGCAALLVNRLIVFLFTNYGPDRLKDRTTHLTANR
jgi:hypothetical protein